MLLTWFQRFLCTRKRSDVHHTTLFSLWVVKAFLTFRLGAIIPSPVIRHTPGTFLVFHSLPGSQEVQDIGDSLVPLTSLAISFTLSRDEINGWHHPYMESKLEIQLAIRKEASYLKDEKDNVSRVVRTTPHDVIIIYLSSFPKRL